MRQNVKKQTVRLTAEEYSHLKQLAAEAGMPMEPLIRKLIMGERLRPRPPDAYADILRELSAIGNNINQIAYWANATKGISSNQIHDAAALVQRAFTLVGKVDLDVVVQSMKVSLVVLLMREPSC